MLLPLAEVCALSRVDIWVVGFESGWSESPADGLRRVFGLDPQEAMTLELTVPTPVKRLDELEAAAWVRALRSIGAQVEQRPAEVGLPPAFDLRTPKEMAPVSTELEGLGQPGAGLDALDGPPGLVMPSDEAKAKAKARAEMAALTKKAKKKPPPSGVVKEEVHRVIRTVSTPEDRRPPPLRVAESPAVAVDEQPSDEFGDLDLDAVAKATKAKARSGTKKKLGATGEHEPKLELEDVRPTRRVDPDAPPASSSPTRVEGPSRGRDMAIGAGLMVVGLGLLYVGIARFESSLLGTGSYLSWLVDAGGFGALLYGLVHLVLTAAGREPELDLSRLVAASVVGFGIAYGLVMMRAPSTDDLAALAQGGGETVDARELVAEPGSRLAETSPDEASAILDAAFEGGAVKVDAGHLQSFLGRRVAHALVIQMPASDGARGHMAALIRRALGAERAPLAAQVPSSGDVWVLPLR